MRLTRCYHFSASHRLDTPALSPEENQRLYGKCNNPHGHGHNYVLELSVAGPLDAAGRVVSVEALDELVRERVLSRMDHKDLNRDVPELAGAVPTTENLARAIHRSLAEAWTLEARLERIRIRETDRNSFELRPTDGRDTGAAPQSAGPAAGQPWWRVSREP